MGFIILVLLVCISLIFIKKYKLCGIAAFFLLCGSITDSAGVLYAIDSVFPYYKLLIWILTFLIFLGCIIYIVFKIKNRTFMLWYFLPFVTSFILIIISTIIQGSSFADLSMTLIMSGIPYFFFWIIGRRKFSTDRLLIFVLLLHASITLLVIVGKTHMEQLNGVTYISRMDANYEDHDYSSLMNKDLSLFNFNKYEVQQTGQFHNSNALGFFSSVIISIGIALLFNLVNVSRLKYSKVYGSILLLVGALLWLNSLTRGPIVFLLLIFIYIYSRKWKISKNILLYFMFFIGFIITLFYFNYSLLEYLFPSFDNVSYTSRLIGYVNGFDAIRNNPMWGTHFDGSPPHMYTIKIMAYHGVLAGLLISLPIFHLLIVTFKRFRNDIKLKNISESTFVMMLFGTLIGVYITNGTVSYVVFGLILGEVFVRSEILKSYYKF